MKKLIDSTTQNWPTTKEWENADEEAFEMMWIEYLGSIEDKVNDEFNVFTEPSVQGGYGSMFIFGEPEDDEDEGFELSVDFQTWTESERKMAAESNSAEEYEDKYRNYLADLI